MRQRLTDSQRQELSSRLPEPFKHLDQRFHHQADSLSRAATARDPVLSAFWLSRMLESCTRCHAAYAGARFPALADPDPVPHHH